MLALTKPEMPVITSMFLKSEGFKDYKELSIKINDCFFRIQDMLQLDDKDDSFTISVRDLKRMSKVANCLLESSQVKNCLDHVETQ